MRSQAGRGALAPVGISPCFPLSAWGHGQSSTRKSSGTTHGAIRVTSRAMPRQAEGEDAVAAPTTIFVCITCRRSDDSDIFPRPGATLATLTAQAADGTGIIVKRVRCLANCERGLSACVRRYDAWSYVFGGLDAIADGTALVEGARLLARSSDGLMPWRGRPVALKRGLIARVPPLDFQEDLE